MATQSTPENTSSTKKKKASFLKTNPWKGWFLIILSSLVALLVIVRIALAPSIIYGATSWLEDQGIKSTIEDININLFNGNISLINAEGHRDGVSLFNIGLIEIHWHWSPLSEKSVVVTKVALDKLYVNIEQYDDKMIISGLDIPKNNPEDTQPEEITEEPNADKEIKPWSASLGEVIFTNLNVCYMQTPKVFSEASVETRFVDYCVDLKEMTWGGTIGYGVDQSLLNSDDVAISSTGTFKLNGLTVTDNILNKYVLESSSNTLSNVTIAGLNSIAIDELMMNGLSALQRDEKEHDDAVRFQDLSIKDIQFRNLNELAVSSLDIDGTGLYIVKTNDTDWEYSQWIPKTPDSQNSNAKSAEAEKKTAQDNSHKDNPQENNSKASPFKFAINNIKVSNSDFCYLEKSTKLYYCFKQDSLDWNGSIKTVTGKEKPELSIKGNLIVNNTNINNPELKRNLLDIKTISLNKLNIASTDKVNFEDFKITNLSALQRGAKSEDNTAAFSNLAVNQLAYTGDAVTINTVQLDKLASNVSKNKDGSWEFDKWLTSKEKNKTDEADNKTESVNSSQTKKEDELKVTINKVTIKTDKELLFVDNSTEPAMTVGLNKLDFNISNLDANKPNAKSPLKLSAKTTRHATIDLEGTVSPFAEKLSFDTEGKLKGFDLRAATPATEKAIGHIIKSGQMDADIKLLSEKGILDSNIGLALYHFQMKSESKEDTAALDEKFGMPLNQTLVLLRDKDDSIHLDIPITGDVNNPEFNPMDAIVKATTKAATVTLITFYTPYGLAYAGGNVLFDLATAMNFDPIKFEPGKEKLTEENKEKLNNLTKLLTEKPQVHLTLCGITNTSDVYALYPDLKPNEKNKDKEIKLNKEQMAALEKLALNRQDNSKQYLIDHAKVEHDRLIVCAPEHKSDEDSISGVEINI